MQLVREFFELNLFHVLTHWQHEDLASRGADPASLLFVEHVRPEGVGKPEFYLRPEELPLLHRAVVEVRAWHADRFYPSLIQSNPGLGSVAGDETLALGETVFGGADFSTVLVVSELPVSREPRERSLDLLAGLGIGHVLEFSAMLADMLERVNAHGNYAPSQTLQTLRLLKRYQLIRRQQLEFSFAADAPVPSTPPPVDAAGEVPDDALEGED